FHLAINAGGRLTLVIEKSGYLSSHRAVQLEWNRRQTLEPVVLVAPSADKTRIQFGATGAMQVARGEVETDADGTRQATVLFPDGIEASATLHDGTEIPLGGVGSLDVRLTEYTVGGAGAAAMPAALPANSAYTYAFAATADGAESIRFSQPVPVYLENFVGFPVGIGMPLAHYDEDRGQWIPHPNGVVLGVVAITGGLADLDLDGDGVAEDDTAMSALAITDQERQTLATLYAPGESLWRLQLPHFSDWDANMGLFPPEEATQPNASVYPRDGENMSEWRDGEGEPAECKEGSQVYCRGGTLGERVPIAGSPYALHYNSTRVVGGPNQVRVTLDPKGNQDPVKRVILRIEPQLGTSTTMRWDSGQMPNEVVWQPDELDLFGRKVTGRLPVDVTLSFVYDCSYQQTDSFGYNGGGIPIGIAPGGGRGGGGASFMAQVPLPPPCEITLSQEMSSYVAELDERSVAGGWSVTPYHRYDVDDGLLVRGDGSSLPLKSAWSTVREIADLDTHEVNPSGPQRSFVQPDGQIVSVSGDVIRALLPDGSEVTPPLATYSTLPCQLMADVVGQPAQGIRLCDDNASGGVERIEPGQDGQILVQAGQSIFRIDRDGIIRDVAGSSIGCGPNTIASPFPLATETCLTSISAFAEGPDGTVYIAQSELGGGQANHGILEVGPDGRIAWAVGDGVASGAVDNDGLAARDVETRFGDLTDLEIGPQGELYFLQECTIYKVFRGFVERIAGVTGRQGNPADPLCHPRTQGMLFSEGVDARSLQLPSIRDMAIDGAGNVLFADELGALRRIEADYGLRTFGGRPESPTCATGEFPTCPLPEEDSLVRSAELPLVTTVSVSPGGDIFVTANETITTEPFNPTFYHGHLFRVAWPNAKNVPDGLAVPSEDGEQVYLFDADGRHLETRATWNNSLLMRFNHDAQGRLASIEDGDGNITSLERNGAGELTGIVAPHGQVTGLVQNADGYLTEIRPDPSRPPYTFGYHGDTGLLASMDDPTGDAHAYTFTGTGRLDSDLGPDGRQVDVIEHARGTLEDVEVQVTGEGSTRYLFDRTDPLNPVRTIIHPDGTSTVVNLHSDGVTERTAPDGTVTVTTTEPDGAFAALSPAGTTSTTLPSGLTRVVSRARSVVGTDPDPLIVQSWSEEMTVNGDVWLSDYDVATRTQVSTSPAGRVTTTVFDSLGRPLSVQRTGLSPVELTYDAKGRLASVDHGSGGDRHVSYSYYPDNNPAAPETSGYLASVTGPIPTETTHLVPDAEGRVVDLQTPDGEHTLMSYDGEGALTSLTPPGRPSHTFAYTTTGHLDTYTAPPSQPGGLAPVEDHDYQPGWRHGVTQRADGRTITSAYDPSIPGRL
ncbi:MAG: hypothetical protein OXR73_28220, partial [Myxococcales bacterium]|nr:hypothetical protein [Myxococcales bacterium]